MLLVEDNLDLAESMAFALAAFGWQAVGPVCTSIEALRSVAGEPFEVAILDVDLGEEMSFPVAEALRSRGIPFVFLTGQLSAEEMPAGFQNELRLTKPVLPESLIEALETLTAGGAVREA